MLRYSPLRCQLQLLPAIAAATLRYYCLLLLTTTMKICSRDATTLLLSPCFANICLMSLYTTLFKKVTKEGYLV